MQTAVGTGHTKSDFVAAYMYFIVAAFALIVANAWNSAFQRLIKPDGVWPAFLYASITTVVAVTIVVLLKFMNRKELDKR